MIVRTASRLQSPAPPVPRGRDAVGGAVYATDRQSTGRAAEGRRSPYSPEPSRSRQVEETTARDNVDSTELLVKTVFGPRLHGQIFYVVAFFIVLHESHLSALVFGYHSCA